MTDSRPSLLFDQLGALIPGHWEKVIATLLLIGLGLMLSHLWARYLTRGEISAHKRRLHLVWARNLIWFVVLLVIVSVWASTIAGFALSLAAVAGALLIVSKELVMCVQGYMYVTVVRPYKVGDFIEFQQLRGCVVDIDMLATTVADCDAAGQMTGRMSEFPNGLLLTQPLRNLSPAGRFELHAIRIPVPSEELQALEQLQARAQAAAEQATGAWLEEAMAQFRRASEENFIVSPSARPQVSWDFSDPKHLVLVVRVACPVSERWRVEQTVFRRVRLVPDTPPDQSLPPPPA